MAEKSENTTEESTAGPAAGHEPPTFEQRVHNEGVLLQKELGETIKLYDNHNVQLIKNHLQVCNASNADRETVELSQKNLDQRLQISASCLQSHAKSQVATCTKNIIAESSKEDEFNTRVRLLLQCHTMNTYIVNSLFEKQMLGKKK